MTPRIRCTELPFLNLRTGTGAAGGLGLVAALLLSGRRRGCFRTQGRSWMLGTSTARIGTGSAGSGRSTAHAGSAGDAGSAHGGLAGTDGSTINGLAGRRASGTCREARAHGRGRGLAGSTAGWRGLLLLEAFDQIGPGRHDGTHGRLTGEGAWPGLLRVESTTGLLLELGPLRRLGDLGRAGPGGPGGGGTGTKSRHARTARGRRGTRSTGTLHGRTRSAWAGGQIGRQRLAGSCQNLSGTSLLASGNWTSHNAAGFAGHGRRDGAKLRWGERSRHARSFRHGRGGRCGWHFRLGRHGRSRRRGRRGGRSRLGHNWSWRRRSLDGRCRCRCRNWSGHYRRLGHRQDGRRSRRRRDCDRWWILPEQGRTQRARQRRHQGSAGNRTGRGGGDNDGSRFRLSGRCRRFRLRGGWRLRGLNFRCLVHGC